MTGTTQHFESQGYEYSYGNKGNFGMISKSSAGQYSNKHNNIKGQMYALMIEIMASNEIEIGIDSIKKIIPTIRGSIASIFDVAYEI